LNLQTCQRENNKDEKGIRQTDSKKTLRTRMSRGAEGRWCTLREQSKQKKRGPQKSIAGDDLRWSSILSGEKKTGEAPTRKNQMPSIPPTDPG